MKSGRLPTIWKARKILHLTMSLKMFSSDQHEASEDASEDSLNDYLEFVGGDVSTLCHITHTTQSGSVGRKKVSPNIVQFQAVLVTFDFTRYCRLKQRTHNIRKI
ncbi:unnamed protein product [Calicophoron daubneyi]|uniref:Uncharacterized protein n=1 Tax=Calicophoron daubneyi TaxID=300641 RepID=A0AAV2U1R2_CALDB